MSQLFLMIFNMSLTASYVIIFVKQLLPTPTIGASVNPLQIYVAIGAYIWVLGVVLLLGYSIISIFLLKKQLKNAQLIEGNIFEAKNLKTPFVLGLIKPKIYLPAGINEEERNYILLHEQTHIYRKDHIIKIVAFLLLSIHWFNPLVWTGFILMSTDMELSCDERVLKQMNEATKKPYANSLLSLATGRHILSGSPLAFFEMQFGSVTVATEIGSAEETGDYNASKKNDNALTFWIKPDEAGHVMGEVAAIQWLNSYKGDDVPETERIRDYVINDVELIAVDMATSDAQMYDYMVTINYSITTASEEYLALEDNISGKGTFDGLHRELYVKGLGKGNFQIVDVSEDALSVRQEIELPNFKYDGQDSIKKLVYDTEIERDSASNNRGGFIIVAPKIFGSYEEEDMLKVFVTTYSARYKLFGNTLSEESGGIIPAAITYRKNNDGRYILEKYEQAKDGSEFLPSIQKYCTMPISEKKIKGLADKILNHYGDYEDIRILHFDNLYEHLKKNNIKDATLTYSQGEVRFSMSDPKHSQ